MSENYSLVAVKRGWVPEWAWRLLCHIRFPFFGHLICIQPFMWFLTSAPADREGSGEDER